MEAEHPSGRCHLLRIPPEIRTNIYRYLLLSGSKYYLEQTSAGGDKYSFHFNAELCDFMIEPGDDSESDCDDENNDPYMVDRRFVYYLNCRPTAIFRTCRLIYSEAVALFYSQLTIILRPSDLGFAPERYIEPTIAHSRIWRHDPLHGIGEHLINGDRIYTTPKLDGMVEPHVFSRFQRFHLNFDLTFCGTTSIDLPSLTCRVDSQMNVNAYDSDVLKMYFRRNYFSMLEKFTKIMSNSTLVRSLSIGISMEMCVNYPNQVKFDAMDTSDEANESRKAGYPFEYAANKKANEALVESGVFYPLTRLGNVQDLTVRSLVRGDKNGYCQPDGIAGEIVRDITTMVTRKFELSLARNPPALAP